jgi:phosphatidylglycerophosphatase A
VDGRDKSIVVDEHLPLFLVNIRVGGVASHLAVPLPFFNPLLYHILDL